MLKIFAYAGSHRENNSISILFLEALKRNLSKYLNDSFKFTIRTPHNSNIKECVGCNLCFETGKCSIKDDMKDIKEEITDCDLFILVSPVFVHNVPGNMKNFIDRIGYWTHLFKLSGKSGLCVSISTSNGNEYVNSYLKKILSCLGVSIIDDISIQTLEMNKPALESYAEIAAKNILKTYKNGLYNTNIEQENLFTSLKNIYVNQKYDSVESLFWKENGYFKFDSYEQLYRNKLSNSQS